MLSVARACCIALFENDPIIPHSPMSVNGRREQWLAAGGTTLGQRLNARVKEILREHRPAPLPASVLAEIQQIAAWSARR